MILARVEIWHNNLIDWPREEVEKLFETIRQELLDIAGENEALLHTTDVNGGISVSDTTVYVLESYD